MPLDNKISNIIGVRAPEWLLSQLRTRSNQNAQEVRSNDNLLYLANKTAWVRLVSSVNITQDDLNYFKTTLGEDTIRNPEDLAKQFVLFGGTSIYLNKDSYQLRAGLSEISPNQKKNGSYGMLGRDEIQRYGYRPMPGINSVTIETQGRLGSVRAATIQFRCWDKAQLDVIDALYFKLGYTMFLEWGHTYFYPSFETKIQNRTFQPGKVASTEFFSIDPFDDNLKGNKEEIYRRIAQNSRDSEGNYDAMLGMATNFTFTYNQEGGYDCTLKIIALGYLADYIKINNPEGLPNLLKTEIKQYNSLLEKLSLRDIPTETTEEENIKDIAEELRKEIRSLSDTAILRNYPSSVLLGQNAKDNFVTEKGVFGKLLYVRKLNAFIPIEKEDLLAQTTITLNSDLIKKTIEQIQLGSLFLLENWKDSNSYKTFEKNYKRVDNGLSYNIRIDRAKIAGSFNTDFRYDTSLIQNFDEIKEKIKSDGLIINENEDLGNKTTFQFEGTQYVDTETSTYIPQFASLGFSEFLKKQFSLSVPNQPSLANLKVEVKYETQVARNGKTIAVYTFRVQNTLDLVRTSKITVKNLRDKNGNIIPEKIYSGKVLYPLVVYFQFTDTDFIESIETDISELEQPFEYENKLKEQDQIEKDKLEQSKNQAASEDQENSPLYSMSTIESMLRTIQLYSLNEAIIEANALDLGLEIRDIEIAKDKKFLQQLFSVGIFKNYITSLINPNSIDDKLYDENRTVDAEYRFKVHAKYGFATSLMANKEKLYENTTSINIRGSQVTLPQSNFTPVDYNQLLTTYVIPYEKNQNIENGSSLNHPVYIQFGTLLMILNHNCTIYDPTGKVQTPLIYIDFNPNENFCLTNPQQLSTNPFIALIPFEGTDDDYAKLFDERIISGYNIKKLSGQGEVETPLFKPRGGSADNRDYVSPAIPKFIAPEGNKESMYKGRIMNILINIDYIMDIIKSYSLNNGENKVFLKPFLEAILSDINKSLGNINVFRLSYNDSGNTLQIVDDQIIPAGSKERQLYLSSENSAELPLVGKNSIAKSLEIKTEVSTRLSNMIAISSNSNAKSKSTLSTSGDNFGFININYVDRYIENKTEINGDTNKNSKDNQNEKNALDAEKRAAIQFNKAIKSFYSSPYPAEDQISFSTNYYINKLIKIKGNEEPTRSSSMIPVSVNFSTDGISGFSMGHAFTISNELLPYTYSARKLQNGKSFIDRVGFVVVGLSHTIEQNTWNTSVRANMIFLKDRSSYLIKDSEERPTEKFYNSRDVDGKTPRSKNVPNAKALRAVLKELEYKEKGQELANWGDITFEMYQLASNLFREIKKENKDYSITITSGNDEFHQTSITYTSNHIYGKGIDFTISPYNDIGKNKIKSTIQKFVSNNPILGFIDEYENQTLEATGGHFHIFINS